MYPKLLQPTDKEIFNLTGTDIEIPKCLTKFKAWRGEPVKETFGGKSIVCVDNKPMFAELAIVQYFIKSGWQSRWIETYARDKQDPLFLLQWKDDRFKNQENSPIKDKKILEILSDITSRNNNSYSGCWDVIAWKGDNIIFAESKRLKRDKIRQTQNNWLSAGLRYGLKTDNFLIVQWEIEQ